MCQPRKCNNNTSSINNNNNHDTIDNNTYTLNNAFTNTNQTTAHDDQETISVELTDNVDDNRQIPILLMNVSSSNINIMRDMFQNNDAVLSSTIPSLAPLHRHLVSSNYLVVEIDDGIHTSVAEEMKGKDRGIEESLFSFLGKVSYVYVVVAIILGISCLFAISNETHLRFSYIGIIQLGSLNFFLKVIEV